MESTNQITVGTEDILQDRHTEEPPQPHLREETKAPVLCTRLTLISELELHLTVQERTKRATHTESMSPS